MRGVISWRKNMIPPKKNECNSGGVGTYRSIGGLAHD
jgi:hypothetical protein